MGQTWCSQTYIWLYIGNTEVVAKRHHPNQKPALYSRLLSPTWPTSDCKATPDFPGNFLSPLPQFLDFSPYFIYPRNTSWLIIAQGWQLRGDSKGIKKEEEIKRTDGPAQKRNTLTKNRTKKKITIENIFQEKNMRDRNLTTNVLTGQEEEEEPVLKVRMNLWHRDRKTSQGHGKERCTRTFVTCPVEFELF